MKPLFPSILLAVLITWTGCRPEPDVTYGLQPLEIGADNA